MTTTPAMTTEISTASGTAIWMGRMSARSGTAIMALPKPKTARTSDAMNTTRRTSTVRMCTDFLVSMDGADLSCDVKRCWQLMDEAPQVALTLDDRTPTLKDGHAEQSLHLAISSARTSDPGGDRAGVLHGGRVVFPGEA